MVELSDRQHMAAVRTAAGLAYGTARALRDTKDFYEHERMPDELFDPFDSPLTVLRRELDDLAGPLPVGEGRWSRSDRRATLVRIAALETIVLELTSPVSLQDEALEELKGRALQAAAEPV